MVLFSDHPKVLSGITSNGFFPKVICFEMILCLCGQLVIIYYGGGYNYTKYEINKYIYHKKIENDFKTVYLNSSGHL